VVLDPSLARGPDVAAGLKPEGLLLVNSDEDIAGAVCVPADRIAPKAVNLVMLGAIAACLGEPPLESLASAGSEVLGGKADPAQLAGALEAGLRAAEKAICLV
jgi:Pyruvate/2-oxoacid:ferredoxin oxidoreductase gamma subunit